MGCSYVHFENDAGNFTFDLVDNLGDAHEACEQMFWMINYLAGGDKDKIKKAVDAFKEIPG